MKLWAIAGLGGALVCCGGESVIGGGSETGGTGGTSGDFTEGAGGTTGGLGGTTGGTGGTTGAAPGTGGRTGGASASGGTAAIGAGGGFPLSNFRDPCDIEATIGRSCALSGCHKNSGAIAPAAGLDLTPDSWLVPRIRDVPARHDDIYCGLELCVPIPEECPVGVVQLADTTDWQASSIYRKLTDPAGCGESMPVAPDPLEFTADDRACFAAFLKDIADFW